jgi:hypothetical protein
MLDILDEAFGEFEPTLVGDNPDDVIVRERSFARLCEGNIS